MVISMVIYTRDVNDRDFIYFCKNIFILLPNWYLRQGAVRACSLLSSPRIFIWSSFTPSPHPPPLFHLRRRFFPSQRLRTKHCHWELRGRSQCHYQGAPSSVSRPWSKAACRAWCHWLRCECLGLAWHDIFFFSNGTTIKDGGLVKQKRPDWNKWMKCHHTEQAQEAKAK